VKIQLLSDLHLESNPGFEARPLPGADLLVLAGDIGSYQSGSQLLARGEPDFGLARFSPLPAAQGGAGWPTPVLFVPGNHEYDGLDFDQTHARLREICDRLGLVWLERQSVELSGVRFVGTTLWTDFEALLRMPGMGADSPAQQARLMDKAFRAANFYLQKTGTLYQGQPMLADQVRAQALVCHAWLRHALAQPFDGPTVVVTHFAPTLASADPRYGFTAGTAGFCNALDDWLPRAHTWLHGHLHCPVDTAQNGCRIVANPLGYARKGEQQGFRPDLLIDVPGRPAVQELSGCANRQSRSW
jgi:predicted phosphodiesterase